MERIAKWLIVYFAIAVWIAVVQLAWSQSRIVGFDLLALQKPGFPVQAAAETLPMGAAIGNLDVTFGGSLENVERLLATERVSHWRVHFFNGPGLRNRQLGSYEPHYGHTIFTFDKLWRRGGGKLSLHLRERAKAYCDLFENYPAVTLEMSPTLEHNLSIKAFSYQVRAVKRGCARARIVNNPSRGVKTTKKYKVEIHSFTNKIPKGACNASFDGNFSADFLRFIANFRSCEVVYYWKPSYNCRLFPGAFIDPRERTSCPSESSIYYYTPS
jgi:hypothetical protein